MMWLDPLEFKPQEGQKIVVRTRKGINKGEYYYIGVWSDEFPLDMVGSKWKPLYKFIEVEQAFQHLKFAFELIKKRADTAERLICDAVLSKSIKELEEYVMEMIEKM